MCQQAFINLACSRPLETAYLTIFPRIQGWKLVRLPGYLGITSLLEKAIMFPFLSPPLSPLSSMNFQRDLKYLEMIQYLLGLVPELLQKVDAGNVNVSILPKYLLFLKKYFVKYPDSSNLSSEFWRLPDVWEVLETLACLHDIRNIYYMWASKLARYVVCWLMNQLTALKKVSYQRKCKLIKMFNIILKRQLQPSNFFLMLLCNGLGGLLIWGQNMIQIMTKDSTVFAERRE